MYVNKPDETKYIYRDLYCQGPQLHGKNLFTVTFLKGQTWPVKGFWPLASVSFDDTDIDNNSVLREGDCSKT
jgi:hypothetical protein